MNSSRENLAACSLDEPGGKCELDHNVQILRNVSVFAGIPIERLRLYAYLSKRVRYRSGDFLFHQGDSDNKGYIVVRGKAQVVRELRDQSIFLHELKEGDFFGGLALLSDIRRLFSVRALDDLECLTIDRETFQKLLMQFPDVAMKVLDLMIKRIVQMEEKFLQVQSEECFYG